MNSSIIIIILMANYIGGKSAFFDEAFLLLIKNKTMRNDVIGKVKNYQTTSRYLLKNTKVY